VTLFYALSEWLELVIFRNEKQHQITFKMGEAAGPLKIVGDAVGQSGTHVTFMPSTEIFAHINFEFSILEHRLRELAFLNSGVRIRLADERIADGAVSEFYFDGGLLAFVEYLNRSRNSLHPTIIANSERDDLNWHWHGQILSMKTRFALPIISRNVMAVRILPVSVGR